MRRWGQHKFGAQRAEADGRSFASKLERAVYELLKLRLAAGEFTQIKCQVSVYLTNARILYKPDFECITPQGGSVFVEAKGLRTPVFAIKLRLWRSYGEHPLEIWEGNYSRPKLKEVVIPRIGTDGGQKQD